MTTKTIMIQHVFRSEVRGQTGQLLDGCHSLADFLDNLKQSEFSCEHGLQALVEAVVRYKELVSDYVVTPTKLAARHLVHGSGLNADGNPTAVGVFYVDEDNPLTATRNHVPWLLDNAQQHYGVTDHTNTIHLFSNGSSVHKNTIEQFIEGQGLSEAVVFHMKDDLAALVEGDEEFWEFFKQGLHCEIEPLDQKLLRRFQKAAVKATKGEKKGKIILPTGTGKTLIEAGIIEATIKGKSKDVVVCVVCSPRIILTYQHIDEISEYLLSRNIDAEYLNLNSGALDEDRIKKMMMKQGMLARDVPSTTSPDVLRRKFSECAFSKVPLIIGATYHSFPKLLNIGFPISLKIADEAHNLVPQIGRFSDNAKKDYHKVKARQSIFVTATPATSPHEEDEPDVGSGMQNKKKFGKVLFKRTPKQMIDAGEIVPPYIHKVEITAGVIKKRSKKVLIPDCKDIENPEIDDIVIMESFEELKKNHFRYSVAPKKMGTKMLVTFKGEQAFSHFFQSELVRKWAIKNNVHLAGMSSLSGAYVDGVRSPPNENYKDTFRMYVDESNASRVERQMIIGHIDMIAEGINIPTLLGVLPLRDLGDIKSAHTLGRAMRLFGPDRADFYEGKTKAGGRDKMIKPYAWVVVPYYAWNHMDGSDRIVQMARRMKNDLGYNPMGKASGSCGDGRTELFQKDPRLPSAEVDSLDIMHKVDNPEFLERKKNEKDIMRKDPKAFRKMIKYVSGK